MSPRQEAKFVTLAFTILTGVARLGGDTFLQALCGSAAGYYCFNWLFSVLDERRKNREMK